MFVFGIDLGQIADYSAAAVLEVKDVPDPPPSGLPFGRAIPTRREHHVRHLTRWPLGTPYTAIAADLGKLLDAPLIAGHPARLRESSTLVVDATGVGLAVCEMLEPLGAPMSKVVVTGGSSAAHYDGGRWLVPKVHLVSVVQLLLGTERLRIAADLSMAKTLADEAKSFTVKVSAAGNEQFGEWRTGKHDDLLFAVAVGAWAGETGIVRMRSRDMADHFGAIG